MRSREEYRNRIAGIDISGAEALLDHRWNTHYRKTSDYRGSIQRASFEGMVTMAHLGDWGHTYVASQLSLPNRSDMYDRHGEIADIEDREIRVREHLRFIEDGITNSGRLTAVNHGTVLAPEGTIITKSPKRGFGSAGEAIENVDNLSKIRELLLYIKENNIAIYTCPTANVNSQRIALYRGHPFYLWLQMGIEVLLNADDFYWGNVRTSLSDDIAKMMLAAPQGEKGRIFVPAAAKEISRSVLPAEDGGKREALSKIFCGNEQLLNTYIDKAMSARNLSREAVINGMFNPTDRQKAQEQISFSPESLRGPPDNKECIMCFGGGSGLLATIKPLKNIFSAFKTIIQSVQSSIDDGGSTFKMIQALINQGYGWIPSMGDLVNSLFKGFATEDKLYKLLDDQGRIQLITDKARKDKKLGDIDKEGNHYAGKQIVFFDEDGFVYLNNFRELMLRLLRRNIEYTLVNGKGIGYGKKTISVSEDFVYFASSILNLTEIIQKYFDRGIIPQSGASIRNLLLLAAMDYTGLIDIDKPAYASGDRNPLLTNAGQLRQFQKTLDLLGEFAGISKARISLSHTNPATVYCLYRDTVVLIEEPGREKDNKHILVIHSDTRQRKAWIKLPASYDEIYSLEWPQRTKTSFSIADDRINIEAGLEEDGTLCFFVNDSPACRIMAPETPEKSSVNYIGEEHLLANDGTGLMRFDTEKAGIYEYKPLFMNGVDVYVRSRFCAMQTNITETANYSRIVDFGAAAVSGEEQILTASGRIETRLLYSPAPELRLTANEDIIAAVQSPRTRGITFGPGSFFTSLMPHFLVRGFADALAARRKTGDISIILVVNPVVDNETAEYSLSEIIEFIETKTGYKADELFTDVIINKFDTTKLEDHFRIEDGDRPLPADWYVKKILRRDSLNEALVQELGLVYIARLVERYRSQSTGLTGRIALRDEDGSKFKVDGRELDQVSLNEYLYIKVDQLLKALYQQPAPDIRIDPGASSKEAKKSRQPLLYSRQEIADLKRRNPRLRIHRDLFLAGLEYMPPREAGEKAKPKLGFLEGYTSFILGEVLGISRNARELTQAYKAALKEIPAHDGKGDFEDIFTVHRPQFLSHLPEEVCPYLKQLSLSGFKRAIRKVVTEDNLAKNRKSGFGITVVAGLPFGEGNVHAEDFNRKVAALKERLKEITNNRVELNEDGTAALHTTIQAVTRTKNFVEGDVNSVDSAINATREKLSGITGELQNDPVEIGDDRAVSLEDAILRIARLSQPFELKVAGFSYYHGDGECSFSLEPVAGYTGVNGKPVLNIKNMFQELPTEAKSVRLHISLGRVTAPLDDAQIEEINDLYGELGFDSLPPFKISDIKVVLYTHRSLTRILHSAVLKLGKENDAFALDDFVAAAEDYKKRQGQDDGENSVFNATQAGFRNGGYVLPDAVRLSRNYQAILKIYDGNTQMLNREASTEADATNRTVPEIVLGRFGDELHQLPAEQAAGDNGIRGSPEAGSEVLILSGGAASRLLIPVLFSINSLFSRINSLLSNIDDGGATQYLIETLVKHGYGVTPPVGDQVNSLFNSFLSGDKVFSILDDSARIRDGYLGLGKEQLLTMSLEDVMIEALRQARSREAAFNESLDALLKGDYRRAEEKLGFIKTELKRIGLGDSLDLRYKNGEELLKKIREESYLPERDRKVWSVEEITNIRLNTGGASRDFIRYSANLVALARVIDEKLVDKGRRPILDMKTLLAQKQSIRNLMLIGALVDNGVLQIRFGPGEERNAIDDNEKQAAYQQSLVNLADAVGITKGMVSVSSFSPSTCYAVYEDNVLAWWEDNGVKKIQRRVKFHLDEKGRLIIGIDQRHSPLMVAKLGSKGDFILSRVSDAWWQFTVTEESGALKLDTGENTLELGIDSGKTYVAFNGDRWAIEENKDGDKTYLVQGQTRIRLKTNNPGCGYEKTVKEGEQTDKIITFAGKPEGDIIFIPRFIAMQTFITETVNFSTIKEFGLADRDIVNGEKIFRPNPFKRVQVSDTNREAVRMIDNTSTLILMGPGSFFTSLMAHFLSEGIIEAFIRAGKRGVKRVFIFNANEDNETRGMELRDLINFVERISGQKFEELFDTVILGDRIDYIRLLAANRKWDGLSRKNDYRNGVRIRVEQALLRNPGNISRLKLDVFKSLIDDYVRNNNLFIPPSAADRYSWTVNHYKEAAELLAEYSEQLSGLLFEDINLRIRAAGGAANEAKRSRGYMKADAEVIERLKDNGVVVYRKSLYGIVTSLDRSTGKPKSSLGYLNPLLKETLAEVFVPGKDGGKNSIAKWKLLKRLYADNGRLSCTDAYSFLSIIESFGPAADTVHGRTILSVFAQSGVELEKDQKTGFIFVKDGRQLKGVYVDRRGNLLINEHIKADIDIIRKGAIAADMDYTVAQHGMPEEESITELKNQLLIFGMLYGVLSANEFFKQLRRSCLGKTPEKIQEFFLVYANGAAVKAKFDSNGEYASDETYLKYFSHKQVALLSALFEHMRNVWDVILYAVKHSSIDIT